MANDPISSDSSATEFSAFCDYVVQMRQQGVESLTPEQSVEQFRNHQSQLRQWDEKNTLSQQQALNGLAQPLDDQAILDRLRQRFDREGTSE